MLQVNKNFTLFVYLGAGSDRIPFFTHFDNNVSKQFKKGRNVGPPEILGDLTRELPFPDESVDLFYTIHTFEHLTYPELINCLLESRRSLKHGGIIRIVVPCFDCMINDYKIGSPVEKDYWEIDKNLPLNTPTDLFIARILYHDHRYLHNYDTLSRILSNTGFSQISVCGPGQTKQSELSEVFYSKENGRVGDVIVEARNLGENPVYAKQEFEQNKKLSLIRNVLENFFNVKIGRSRRLLPMFPEKKWFYEMYLKIRSTKLIYFKNK